MPRMLLDIISLFNSSNFVSSILNALQILLKYIYIFCAAVSHLNGFIVKTQKASVSIRTTAERILSLQPEPQSLRWLSVKIKEQERGLFVSLMSLILLLKQVHFGKCALELNLPLR